MIAGIMVYAAVAPLAVRLAMIPLVGLSLFYYLARDVFLSLSGSWCEISLGNNGATVVAKNGRSFIAQISNTTIVSPCCIVLRIRPDGQHLLVSRVILPDALSAGEFRELRVCLKFA
jgi:hypothetical protein